MHPVMLGVVLDEDDFRMLEDIDAGKPIDERSIRLRNFRIKKAVRSVPTPSLSWPFIRKGLVLTSIGQDMLEECQTIQPENGRWFIGQDILRDGSWDNFYSTLECISPIGDVAYA